MAAQMTDHFSIGQTYHREGRLDLAREHYQMAQLLDGRNASVHYNLALVEQQEGRTDEALDAYRKAIAADPHHYKAHGNLGSLLFECGRYKEALPHLHEALKGFPTNEGMLRVLAQAYSAIGSLRQAASYYRELIRICPDVAQYRLGLASELMLLGDYDEAKLSANEALRIDSEDTTALALSQSIAGRLGQAESACQVLEARLHQGAADLRLLLAYAEVARAAGREAEAILELRDYMAGNEFQALPAKQQARLRFRLAMLLDSEGHYSLAFENLDKANRCTAIGFDSAAHDRYVQRIIDVFTPARFSDTAAGNPTLDRFVFIVGMPRSGTTLVEQILAAHPDLYAAGEQPWIEHIASGLQHRFRTTAAYPEGIAQLSHSALTMLAGSYVHNANQLNRDCKRFTDKMPTNFLHLGLIALLFPRARVIHCVREPLDTCLSCYFTDFAGDAQPYSRSLPELGRYYNAYARLMAHWRRVLPVSMTECRYAELVQNPRDTVAHLLDLCGLGWDARCLAFHESKRKVATASHAQVTRPLYASSIGRWRNYRRELQPLIDSLDPQLKPQDGDD